MDVICKAIGYAPCEVPSPQIECVITHDTGERHTRVRSQVYAYLLRLARQAENRASIPVLIPVTRNEECTND